MSRLEHCWKSRETLFVGSIMRTVDMKNFTEIQLDDQLIVFPTHYYYHQFILSTPQSLQIHTATLITAAWLSMKTLQLDIKSCCLLHFLNQIQSQLFIINRDIKYNLDLQWLLENICSTTAVLLECLPAPLIQFQLHLSWTFTVGSWANFLGAVNFSKL